MTENKMIVIVRIKGQVKVRGDFIETMKRMNLKKKYTCIVIEKPNAEQLGMLKKIENFVATEK